MHRHAYNGRKLSRQRDQRLALVRGQIISLVLYEHIETTLAKAKTVAPEMERLITKAKSGTLADRRSIEAEITSSSAVKKLMTDLAPRFKDRTGGYTRIIKTSNRLGDNAPMAVLSLVISEPAAKPDDKTEAVAESTPKAKPAAKKPAVKRSAKTAGAKS
ncbi:MAG TPA: 50S ribosomal protein L17 [Candidatus Saccharimonadales bacterium]|nr:50S ribosomal protein L17 [Candidatus Saccharimonadales bacterium]